jgi:hypothetical protein
MGKEEDKKKIKPKKTKEFTYCLTPNGFILKKRIPFFGRK